MEDDEAELLLDAHGDAPAEARRLNRIARGHPLALVPASAAARERPDLVLEDAVTTRVVTELTRIYLEDVPDPLTRRALEGQDAAAIFAIAARHDGPDAVAQLRSWWETAPRTFSVIRDRDATVRAFFVLRRSCRPTRWATRSRRLAPPSARPAAVQPRARPGTDIAVVRATLPPGGETGWHEHIADSMVVVKSGAIKMYEPRRRGRCEVRTFGPGRAFVHPGHVHNFVNETTQVAEFYVVYMVPAGAAPLLTDVPTAPAGCA